MSAVEQGVVQLAAEEKVAEAETAVTPLNDNAETFPAPQSAVVEVVFVFELAAADATAGETAEVLVPAVVVLVRGTPDVGTAVSVVVMVLAAVMQTVAVGVAVVGLVGLLGCMSAAALCQVGLQ